MDPTLYIGFTTCSDSAATSKIVDAIHIWIACQTTFDSTHLHRRSAGHNMIFHSGTWVLERIGVFVHASKLYHTLQKHAFHYFVPPSSRNEKFWHGIDGLEGVYGRAMTRRAGLYQCVIVISSALASRIGGFWQPFFRASIVLS
jgi:hypothetical protein